MRRGGVNVVTIVTSHTQSSECGLAILWILGTHVNALVGF